MKQLTVILSVVACAALPVSALDIAYGNKGTDGALVVNANRQISLDGAETASWDAKPTVQGTGVYDTNQWAVVFKYSSVDIAQAAVLTFANHGSRAPVVWLVDGDVRINGTINVSGSDGDGDVNVYRLSEPGPGGFRGGDRYANNAELGGSGLGPGGALSAGNGGNGNYYNYPSFGSQGGRGTDSIPFAPTYGNSRLVPLIGGSGGAGFRTHPGVGAGAGGGAILIVASGRITLNGKILADGGRNGQSVGGSGGAIRLVADSVAGVGLLSALSEGGGHGRIRIEAKDYRASLNVRPITQPVPPATPVMLWPTAEYPSARIVSVSGAVAPSDPRSSMGPPESQMSDITLTEGAGTGEIIIETDNLPKTATVMLRLTPRNSDYAQEVRADYVGETVVPGRLRWSVQRNLHGGFCAMQVRATAQ